MAELSLVSLTPPHVKYFIAKTHLLVLLRRILSIYLDGKMAAVDVNHAYKYSVKNPKITHSLSDV